SGSSEIQATSRQSIADHDGGTLGKGAVGAWVPVMKMWHLQRLIRPILPCKWPSQFLCSEIQLCFRRTSGQKYHAECLEPLTRQLLQECVATPLIPAGQISAGLPALSI